MTKDEWDSLQPGDKIVVTSGHISFRVGTIFTITYRTRPFFTARMAGAESDSLWSISEYEFYEKQLTNRLDLIEQE